MSKTSCEILRCTLFVNGKCTSAMNTCIQRSDEERVDELEGMVNQLQSENTRLCLRIIDLDDALSLAHTELTSNLDWPDSEHQRFVDETMEQALKETK